VIAANAIFDLDYTGSRAFDELVIGLDEQG
jgi:hypothetical protein